MKGSDRAIVLVLPLVALVIGFYLLVISPKQKEVGKLDDQITALNGRVDAAQNEVATAEQARKSFDSNYAEIVSLGSAVPEDSDQATLIYDLTKTSQKTGVQFRSFELADATAAETVGTATTTEDSTTAPAAGGESTTSTSSSTTTTTSATPSAAATEADASTLPIGATVGPAGLPVMPYKLKFSGSFFDMADFFAALDKEVEVNDKTVDPKVSGRLMTVNGFVMVGDPVHGFPDVQASLALNTYIVPADQGISAGASPAGPAPAAAGTESTVTSASTSSEVPGTAAVTP